MFEFGRELRRIFGQNGRLQSDTSLYELMNLELLVAQGRALDIEAGRVSTKNRFDPYIEAAKIWREYARRTGDPLAMRKAASSAENAGKEAKTAIEASLAALEQAQTCILGVDLFETYELLSSAEQLLGEGRSVVSHDPELLARFTQVEARLAARLAMRSGVADLEPALLAMSHIDRAVERMDKQVRASKSAHDKIEAALARFERADLLMLVGLDRDDPSLMKAVITDLEAVQARLDPHYEPITYARTTIRVALAYIYKGQIDGDQNALSTGIALLSPNEEIMTYEHSPLDWVQEKLALAQGLQALAELSLDQATYDKAIAIYDWAIKRPLQKGLSLRSQVMNNRAACMAKRAELKGDLRSLEQAELAFKAELKQVKPSEDPVSWAILQTNLAKLYVARGDILGIMLERTEAAYALEAAYDIFIDHGLKTLADTAMEHLVRVREPKA